MPAVNYAIRLPELISQKCPGSVRGEEGKDLGAVCCKRVKALTETQMIIADSRSRKIPPFASVIPPPTEDFVGEFVHI